MFEYNLHKCICLYVNSLTMWASIISASAVRYLNRKYNHFLKHFTDSARVIFYIILSTKQLTTQYHQLPSLRAPNLRIETVGRRLRYLWVYWESSHRTDKKRSTRARLFVGWQVLNVRRQYDTKLNKGPRNSTNFLNELRNKKGETT